MTQGHDKDRERLQGLAGLMGGFLAEIFPRG